ncbi:MAG: hypothetical protein GTO40_07045, partial [Deltaproteobacteria bacterium]|nr:hypothetical protein [Deltaproteobacteria bacterium]
WLGVNHSGVLVGIVNRRSESIPAGVEFKSRGLLCLQLLQARHSGEAMDIVQREKATDYRPFNLLFADSANAFVVFNTEHEIQCVNLSSGLHVLGNASVYDSPMGKASHAQDMFTNSIDEIDEGDRSTFVRVFQRILGNHQPQGQRGGRDAICVHAEGYGTVSSTIVLYRKDEQRFYYYHTGGAPCRSEYQELSPITVLS